MVHKTKARIAALGIRSVDVAKEIENRGEKCDPTVFSAAIHGNYTSPKYVKVASMADEILAEWEADPTKIRRS